MSKLIAWVIEPKKPGSAPYLTLKRAVAEKRAKAGDHVTDYHSKNEPEPEPDEDEL